MSERKRQTSEMSTQIIIKCRYSARRRYRLSAFNSTYQPALMLGVQ
jgi:hypothetical protein